jgi:hypothetical protein
VSLKELESWLKRGQKVPFLREICSPQKCTPKIGANIGAINGILLKPWPTTTKTSWQRITRARSSSCILSRVTCSRVRSYQHPGSNSASSSKKKNFSFPSTRRTRSSILETNTINKNGQKISPITVITI